MHENLRWKHEAHDADDTGDNIGLELKDAVEAGTVLLKVPRSIVFDARRIRGEPHDRSPDQVGKALQLLEQSGFAQHAEGFFLFVKLWWECCREGNASFWAPYIQSLPRQFVTFTEVEKSCLPYYSQYIAEYQDKKFEAFRDAALASGLIVDADEGRDGDESKRLARWAFSAVSSRFWNSRSTEAATVALMEGANGNAERDTGTSELVPVGDMFNHREPPNVGITHEGEEFVTFVYKGTNGEKNGKDLYISYGQPGNVHRFLGIFGFIPDGIPNVWSHVSYPSNPFSDDVERMVFRTSDGQIADQVWDAVLFALMEPEHAPDELPQFTKEQHRRYREFTTDVLQTHIEKHLSELAALRLRASRIEEACSGGDPANNVGLIRQQNELLTGVFERALQQVKAIAAEE